MDESDVLVLGAGPAGCAAALRVRKAGLKVVVLEAAHSSRPGPGETLHPGIEAIFRQIGVLSRVTQAGFHRHRGIWVEWDGARQFVPYGSDASGEWCGWQIPRECLQALLREALYEAGVDLRIGVQLRGLSADRSRVEGIATDAETFRARYYLDATGVKCWLGTQLGCRAINLGPKMRVRCGWQRGTSANADGEPSLHSTTTGWHWRAPLNSQRTAWVRLDVVGVANGNLSEHQGREMTWRERPECAGPNWFLLGDAAMVFDPSSSHGILRGMMSGILAGHLIAGVSDDKCPEEEAMRAYVAWHRETCAGEAKRLREFYRKHPSASVAASF